MRSRRARGRRRSRVPVAPARFRRGTPSRPSLRLRMPVIGFAVRTLPDSRRRQHDADDRARISLSCFARSRCAARKDCDQVASRRCISGLCLRIAQADVELQDLGPVGSHHQTGVEKAGEAVASHRRGQDDACPGSRCVCAASESGSRNTRPCRRCWDLVAVEDGFVVLRRRERHDVAAVAERDEADFFAARNSSITRPALSVASAASASARSCAITTPLPAASPSALDHG